MYNWLINFYKKWKYVLGIAGMFAYCLVSVYLIEKLLPAFTAWAYGQLLVYIFILNLRVVDILFLPGYDTLKEIKKGNSAASIAFLAVAVIFLGCIMAAFVVFR